jgi:hypothetical protein
VVIKICFVVILVHQLNGLYLVCVVGRLILVTVKFKLKKCLPRVLARRPWQTGWQY